MLPIGSVGMLSMVVTARQRARHYGPLRCARGNRAKRARFPSLDERAAWVFAQGLRRQLHRWPTETEARRSFRH